MYTKRAVSLLRYCISQRKSQTKHEYTKTPHADRLRKHSRVHKWLDSNFATQKSFRAVYGLMKRHFVLLVLIVCVAGPIFGQEVTSTPTQVRKRVWLSCFILMFSIFIVPQFNVRRMSCLALVLK